MIKVLRKHLVFFGFFALYYIFLDLLDTTCLIKKVFGFHCPTCGATRSLISLLTLDFKGYWYYHPASILIVVALFLGLHRKNILKNFNNLLFNLIFYGSLVIIVVTYIIRLSLGIIP